MEACQLVTIPFSHFCEKARWALDLARIPYREKPYVPGLHMLGTKVRGRGRSVPVLITPEGCFTDSTDILRFVDRERRSGPQLYPTAMAGSQSAAEIEDWLDEELGPAVRLFAYRHLLPEPKALFALTGPTFSQPQRLLFRSLLPVVGKLIARSYRINDERALRARARVVGTFTRVDALLADGRKYLAGAAFSAADLTFAALAGPVLCYPEMQYRRGKRATKAVEDAFDQLPAEFVSLVRELRGTAAADHGLRMYREFRRF